MQGYQAGEPHNGGVGGVFSSWAFDLKLGGSSTDAVPCYLDQMGKPNIFNIFELISRLEFLVYALSTLYHGTLKAEGKGRRRQELHHQDTGSQKAADLFG